MILCGWGRGRFREGSTSAFNEEKELKFLATPDGLAILDNFGSFAEQLDYAKQKKPENAKICYHKTTQDPSGNWVLTQDLHQVMP